MLEYKLVNAPILVSEKLSIDQCPNIQEGLENLSCVPYATIVVSLMYTPMICIRLDIFQAIGVLSRYTSKLEKEHWEAIKKVFKYLHGTIYYAILYFRKT